MAEKGIVAAHALFFGCDMGDRDTWLGELNATDLAQEWITEGSLFSYKVEKTSERIHRLGLEIKNFKQNWRRIAPMKNSKITSGLLSEKIPEVQRWVKDTLDQANLGSVPNNFTVVPAKESPKLGEPFDVLWVKFIIDESRWDDEVMWDIRYLLMGSKLD